MSSGHNKKKHQKNVAMGQGLPMCHVDFYTALVDALIYNCCLYRFLYSFCLCRLNSNCSCKLLCNSCWCKFFTQPARITKIMLHSCRNQCRRNRGCRKAPGLSDTPAGESYSYRRGKIPSSCGSGIVFVVVHCFLHLVHCKVVITSIVASHIFLYLLDMPLVCHALFYSPSWVLSVWFFFPPH